MNITMIALIGENNELGFKNDLLIRIPEDMKFFRKETINKPIVMGLNTLKSLNGLLPNRKHIVLTHQDLEENKNLVVCHSMEELLFYLKTLKEEIMVIGGGMVYKQMIDYANKMLITKVDKTFEADVYFPNIDDNDWNVNVLKDYKYHDISYRRLCYQRKR